MHIKGHLSNFIKNFLLDRKFSFRLLNQYSEEYEQETGVPQGSVISTTLFIIKINSITNSLPLNVKHFFYVDDFVICYSSHNMNENCNKLFINLKNWLNGFKFSRDKTSYTFLS